MPYIYIYIYIYILSTAEEENSKTAMKGKGLKNKARFHIEKKRSNFRGRKRALDRGRV